MVKNQPEFPGLASHKKKAKVCQKKGETYRTSYTRKDGTKVGSTCVKKTGRKKRADAGMPRAEYRAKKEAIKSGKAKGIHRGELVY